MCFLFINTINNNNDKVLEKVNTFLASSISLVLSVDLEITQSF